MIPSLDHDFDGPTFISRLGRFDDGVRTDCRSNFKDNCHEKKYDNEYGGGKYPPEYYYPPYRTKSKTISFIHTFNLL